MQHHFKPGRLRSALAAIAVTSGLGLAQPLLAQSVTADIHLQAQALGTALDDLARQTGARLLYSPDAVKGKQAPAVDGMSSVEAALNKLLAGTGLEWSARNGAYAIRPAVQAPADGAELAPITVTATRTEHSVDDVPASVTIIGQRDIRTQQPTQLVDLLRNVEGIDVAGWGSPASLPMIRMRGIGGSFGGQTSQILVDGLPMESPVAGIHQGLDALSLFDLERVEVVRGPASALYGPNAVGGVVNFMSKRWRGAPGGELAIGTGSHDALLVAGAIGGAWDQVDFRLSATDYDTNGFTAQPTADPWGSKDLAPRDGQRRTVGFSMGLRPTDNQEITLAIRKGDAESAWLGGHPNYRINDDTELYDLGYRYEADALGVLKVRYRETRQKAHLYFDDEYWNGNTGSLILADIDDRVEKNHQFDVQADIRLNTANLLTLGYAYGWSEYWTRENDVLADSNYETSIKSTLTGVFVQDEHRFSDALSVLVGGRWDRYEFSDDIRGGVLVAAESSDSVFNPRAGVRYRLAPTVSLYATAGTAYVPAPSTLKYRTGTAWLANPGLKPETSTSYEVGGDYRSGPWAARIAVFHTDYKDLISSNMVGTKRQFQNIGRVTVDGLELSLEATQGTWQPYANLAYTRSIIKENPSDPQTVGRHLQRIAPVKANLGVTFAPTDSVYARLSGRYVDDYYFNDRNTPAALNPHHTVVDAKIGWRLPVSGFAREAELSLAVNNLFDEGYREQQYEYMDGRNVWLNLSARF